MGKAGLRALTLAVLAAACGGTPTAPPPASGPVTLPPPANTQPFELRVTPDILWIGVGRQSGNLKGAVTPNKGFWATEVRATGTLGGSIKRVEQVLRERLSRATLGGTVASGPFWEIGNTPQRVVDPLKQYGRQTFQHSLDLGFDGRAADLHTTVVVEDATRRLWTLEQTTPWELLAALVPISPVNVTVRQNDPSSGCPFDSVHGYGIVIELAWDPPPTTVPVTSYMFSVIDGKDREVGDYFYPTETKYRLRRCGMHVGAGAEGGARFGIRTYYAPSHAVSGYATALFDFQSCREADVPACR